MAFETTGWATKYMRQFECVSWDDEKDVPEIIFLSIDYGFKLVDHTKFYKNPNIGDSKTSRYIKNICEKWGIEGEDLRYAFSMHSLRATGITNRFESGIQSEPRAIQNAHFQTQSLKSYQKTRGNLGEKAPGCSAARGVYWSSNSVKLSRLAINKRGSHPMQNERR